MSFYHKVFHEYRDLSGFSNEAKIIVYMNTDFKNKNKHLHINRCKIHQHFNKKNILIFSILLCLLCCVHEFACVDPHHAWQGVCVEVKEQLARPVLLFYHMGSSDRTGSQA